MFKTNKAKELSKIYSVEEMNCEVMVDGNYLYIEAISYLYEYLSLFDKYEINLPGETEERKSFAFIQAIFQDSFIHTPTQKQSDSIEHVKVQAITSIINDLLAKNCRALTDSMRFKLYGDEKSISEDSYIKIILLVPYDESLFSFNRKMDLMYERMQEKNKTSRDHFNKTFHILISNISINIHDAYMPSKSKYLSILENKYSYEIKNKNMYKTQSLKKTIELLKDNKVSQLINGQPVVLPYKLKNMALETLTKIHEGKHLVNIKKVRQNKFSVFLQEKGVDTNIVMSIMDAVHNKVDFINLITNDSDFSPIVERAVKNNNFIISSFTNKKFQSKDLIKEVGAKNFLSMHDIYGEYDMDSGTLAYMEVFGNPDKASINTAKHIIGKFVGLLKMTVKLQWAFLCMVERKENGFLAHTIDQFSWLTASMKEDPLMPFIKSFSYKGLVEMGEVYSKYARSDDEVSAIKEMMDALTKSIDQNTSLSSGLEIYSKKIADITSKQ